MRRWYLFVVGAPISAVIVWLALRHDRRGGPLAVVDVRTKRDLHEGVYLEMRYRPPTSNAARDPRLVTTRTACAVGARVFVQHDDFYAFADGNADDHLDHGLVFIENPLPGRPSRCQIELASAETGETANACLAVPSSDARTAPVPGACDPPLAPAAQIAADTLDDVTPHVDGDPVDRIAAGRAPLRFCIVAEALAGGC